MKRFAIFILLLSALSAVSCNRDDFDYKGEYKQVFIYFGLGYNNLSNYLSTNLYEMCKGTVPGPASDRAIVAFCHNTASTGDYSTPNPPCLIRICRKDGATQLDTIKTYPADATSASTDMMYEVLSDIKVLFPSKTYGMLLSSHGTGWMPQGYKISDSGTFASSYSLEGHNAYPLTKAIGAQFKGSSDNSTWIDVPYFAKAFPMKMEYIIFDTCLMGGVEVAYELKDVCHYLVASPAEVLVKGFIYESLSWNLLSGEEADLKKVCSEYYDFYLAQTGEHRSSATISLIDCTAIDGLAAACSEIYSAHRSELDTVDRTEVQAYFYDNKRWYYDLRDLAKHIDATDAELRTLDAALAACVPYHAETEYFFDLQLNHCCGLSTYIPIEGKDALNNFYKNYSWNTATGFVK